MPPYLAATIWTLIQVGVYLFALVLISRRSYERGFISGRLHELGTGVARDPLFQAPIHRN